MVESLLDVKSIDLSVKNKEGLTALDICESKEGPSFRQNGIWRKLTDYKASRAKQGHRRNLRMGESRLHMFCHPKADLKQMANTLSVIATLLAAVTFTVAFTMPGGYNSNAPNAGVAVFVRKFAFQVFILSDTIALCSSITAAFLLIWAMLGDPAFLANAVKQSFLLLSGYAMNATMIAFMTGIYVVISSESLWLAIVVCILCSSVPFLVTQRFTIASISTPEKFILQRLKTERL